MLEMLDATAHDPGCYHCGFARSGDRLVWRSQFDDVDVLARNMRALGPLMNRMMAEAATLDSLELHAAPSASSLSRLWLQSSVSLSLNSLKTPKVSQQDF